MQGSCAVQLEDAAGRGVEARIVIRQIGLQTVPGVGIVSRVRGQRHQQLHFGGKVRWRRAAGQGRRVVADIEIGADDLASQAVLNLIGVELTQAALNQIGDRRFPHGRIGCGRQAGMATGETHGYADLVFLELGRLDQDDKAVGIGQLGDAEIRNVLTLGDCRSLTEVGIGPDLVGLCFILGQLRALDGGVACVQGLLVEITDGNARMPQQRAVPVKNLWDTGIDRRQRDRGAQGLEEFVVLGRRGGDFAAFDRIDQTVSQGAIVTRFFALNVRLEVRIEVGQGAVEFRLIGAEQLELANRCIGLVEGSAVLTFFWRNRQLRVVGRVLRAELIEAGGGKRCLRLFRLTFQPVVDDRGADLVEEIVDVLGLGLVVFVLGLRPGQRDPVRQTAFGVDIAAQWLLGKRAEVGDAQGLVTRRLPIAELRFDLGFDNRRIEVADGDHRGAFRAVIGVIEIDELIGLGILDDVDQTDRQAFRVFLTGIGGAGPLLELMRAGRIAQTLFTENNAALAVDGVGRQGQIAAGFTQQKQCGVDVVVADGRQVELIDGLVETGEGVGVRAEFEAVALQDLDHIAFGHVLRAVERHVFQEVRQPALLLGLHH